MRYDRFFIFILVFSLVAPILVCLRLIDISNWATGANRVKWMYGDGTPVPQMTDEDRPWPACRPSDTGLNTLRHDQALWTVYRSIGSNGGNEGFARIDPASGIGTVWRFSKDAQHVWTSGMATGPEREVAIVYRANRDSLELALGILEKEQGWVYKPQILPNSSEAHLLAVSWVSGKLNVIYRSINYISEEIESSESPSDRHPVWIVNYDDGKISRSRFNIPEPVIKKGALNICRAFFRDNAWHLAYSHGYNGQLYYIKEDGTFRIAEDTTLSCLDLIFHADKAAVGLTVDNNSVSLGDEDAIDLTIDGKVRPFPIPLFDSWRSNYFESWLESGRAGLTRCPFWDTREADDGRANRMGDDWLVLYKRKANTVSHFEAKMLDANGDERLSRPIALATSSESGSLFYGVPISREEGGIWIVSQEGSYAAFGDDFNRLDPLPLFQHLRTSGSRWLDENKWFHIVEFFWVLFGLPVCLVLGFFVAKVLRKQLYPALCWGGAAYLILGYWSLKRVLPLMQ